MQTEMRNRPFWRSRWWMPLFALALGAAIFAAYAIGGEPGVGLAGFGVMAAMAALFALGNRSETLRGLGGPGRDERWEAIDTRATALAGHVFIIVILGAWLWEVANGEDGSPYTQLGAVAGLAYVLAVAFLRWRS
jgi:multisubunit Na+/H+ antiporter MnhB subunit